MKRWVFLIGFFFLLDSPAFMQAILTLDGAYMVMSHGTQTDPVYLTVSYPAPNAIQRTAGHIHSENQYHYVRWNTDVITGNYTIPFGVGGNATDYIPLDFTKNNSVLNTIDFSTYPTNPANIPYPTASVSNASAVGPVTGMPQSNLSIDRFWMIETSNAIDADITFRYRGIENTTATCWNDTLKAQNWNGGSWNALQRPGNPGVNTGIGSVGPVNFNTFGQFALTLHPLEIEISDTTHVSCFGLNDGSAEVTGQGGLGPYTYQWTPAGGNTATAQNLYAGNYTVTVSGANGCSQTASVTITEPPQIIINLSSNSPVCENGVLSFQANNLNNHTYQWTGPSNFSSNTNSNTIDPALVPNSGTYVVTVTNTITNCTNTASISLIVNPNPIASFTTQGNEFFENQPIQFLDQSIGNNTITTWNWDMRDGGTYSTPNPIHSYNDTGFYNVQLTVTNNFGCTDETTLTLYVNPVFTFFIPNTFTPNRDFLNEIFTVHGRGIKEFYMEIFNRWGQLIFETNDLITGWNGYYNNERVPVGVYVYKIYVLDNTNKEHQFIGNVNVLY